ncbi:protein rolling stone-like [Contarinia nasturtii]|uniref:protein rolling stone-like n=1 Tax=Contarinia nasturtii TaxID=265458 RepID=UPI0012D44F4D|nr:protein rolling stone-like [Contarinia nasturtii]
MVKKTELHVSNCGFNHDLVDSFVTSQWQSKSRNTFYLIYRWCFAAFVTCVFVISLYAHVQGTNNFGKFFIYITRWGLMINLIVGIYGALLVTLWHFCDEYRDGIQTKQTIPRKFQVYWALHTVALELSFVITIVYWSILYDHDDSIDLPNILAHIMNSVIMFLDFLIIGFPMRLYHVIQLIFFGVCYAIFSYIYYICGGHNAKGKPYIYRVLYWKDIGKASTTVFGVITLGIIIHFVLFWIYKLRVFIRRRFFTAELK